MFENLEFSTRSKAYKELGISYLGGVATSTKIMHSLKEKKIATYCLYLAPANLSGRNVCPNSTNCAPYCLYGSGLTMIDILSGKNKITHSRIKKTKLFFSNRKVFMSILVSEIRKEKVKYEKLGYEFSVRLNGTSDLSPELFVLNGKNILEIFPDIQFYDYSKVENRFKLTKKYNNYDISFSYDGFNMDKCINAIKNNIRISMVFESIPNYFNGIKVINGDKYDARYLDPTNVIIGLKLKLTASTIKNHKRVLPDTPFIIKPTDIRCS